MLMMPVSACAPASTGSHSAICGGTHAARTAHTEALLQDGGDRSVVTGQALIAKLDAGCDDVK